MLVKKGCTVEPCGSRVTCDPPPVTTDADFLVEVKCSVAMKLRDAVSDVVGLLWDQEFTWEGSEHYQEVAASDFMSWRRDHVNLIVTASPRFAQRHRVATALCRRLNLMSKPDRIALFQAVLYGVVWREPVAVPPGATRGGVEGEVF